MRVFDQMAKNIGAGLLLAAIAIGPPACLAQTNDLIKSSGCTPAQVDALAATTKLDRDALVDKLAVLTCKKAPSSIGDTILGAAVQTTDEDTHNLVILVLAPDDGVKASRVADAGEDAGMNLGGGNIRIDTAPYQVSADTRLLGIDLTSRYMPNCGDGGFDAIRTLYRVHGGEIQPVLPDLFMTEWEFVNRGPDRCNNVADDGSPTIIEEFSKTISISPETTNGFHDLLIRGESRLHITDSNGKESYRPSKRKPTTFRLKFDGRTYPTETFDREWWKWRS